jgi:hypothetical protein
MSLLDLVSPPTPPQRRSRIVRADRLDAAAERRKEELLQQQERARIEAGREAKAARMKALHADPEFKAKTAARMKALNADPEFKAKVSKAASARMKALNADPEFKARMKARRIASRLARLRAAIAALESGEET